MLADCDIAAETRIFDRRIVSDLPFSYVPLVHVGIIDNRDSALISVRAEEISNERFSLYMQTWRQSNVYRMEIGWLVQGNT